MTAPIGGLGKRTDRPATYGASLSTGAVTAFPSLLCGFTPSTSGKLNFMDSTLSVGKFVVTAGTAVWFSRPIQFLTNISISASAAVAVVYWSV